MRYVNINYKSFRLLLAILVLFGLNPVIAQEDRCIILKKIVFTVEDKRILTELGGSMFVRDFNKNYKNKCINSDLLKKLIKDLTNISVEQGFITLKNSIAEQDLSTGVLKVTISGGKIAQVGLKENDKKQEINWLGFPLKPGKILNLRDVEQAVDHYSNLRSSSASFSIEPGNDNGSSNVVLEKNDIKKKWYVETGLDNHGLKSKGELQSTSKLILEDITNSREVVSLLYKTNADNKRDKKQDTKAISLSFPINYSVISCSLNQNSYKNYVKGVRDTYQLKGGSKSYTISIDQTIHRNKNGKSSVFTSLARENYSNYFENNIINISSYLIKKIDLGFRYQGIWWGGILSSSLSSTYGETTKFLHRKLPGSIYDRNFAKINTEATFNKTTPIKIADKFLEYRIYFKGQLGLTPLVGTEKMNVTSLDAVRGYKDYAESADSAAALHSDIIFPLKTSKAGRFYDLVGESKIFLGIDFGAFKNREIGCYRTGFISAVAAGIRNRKGIVSYDLTYAKTIQNANDSKSESSLYFSMNLSI